MKVFMLGWEFPPHISGGLGTACYGLTKGLDEVGVEVSFVLPTAVSVEGKSHVNLRSPATLAELPLGQPQPYAAPSPAEPAAAPAEIAENVFEHVHLYRVDACLQPYASPVGPEEAVRHLKAKQIPPPSRRTRRKRRAPERPRLRRRPSRRPSRLRGLRPSRCRPARSFTGPGCTTTAT